MSVAFPVNVIKSCETRLRGKGVIMAHGSHSQSTTAAAFAAAAHIASAIRRVQLMTACGNAKAVPRRSSFVIAFIYT